eukprot:gene19065-24887_t
MSTLEDFTDYLASRGVDIQTLSMEDRRLWSETYDNYLQSSASSNYKKNQVSERESKLLANIIAIEQSSIHPSSFGNLDGDNSWSQNVYKLELQIHRPSASSFGISTSLLHPLFGKFVDDLETNDILDQFDCGFTMDFTEAMSGRFVKENSRQNEAFNLLQMYFKEDISPTVIDNTNYGGAICCNIGNMNSFHKFKACLLLIEVNNELGGSVCSATEKNIGNYLQYLNHCGKKGSRLIYESVCPAILMTIIGPNLSISFAAHTNNIVADPITPFLPLLLLRFDKEMMLNVTRVLKATKLYIKDIKKYYQTYELSGSTVPNINKLFPYYDGIKDNIVDTASSTATLRWIYDSQVSRSGWKVIVMEYLDPNLFNIFVPTTESLPLLRGIIDCLHANNYVHGDIRNVNVLMSKSNELDRMRICLINFDWSGIENKTTYPSFMSLNNEVVDWPDDVSCNKPLKKDHDNYMFDRYTVLV